VFDALAQNEAEDSDGQRAGWSTGRVDISLLMIGWGDNEIVGVTRVRKSILDSATEYSVRTTIIHLIFFKVPNYNKVV